MTDINEIDELFSRKIPFKIRFKNMAWHYLLTFLSWLGFWGEKTEVYTISIHIKNLKEILKERHLIKFCPAVPYYNSRRTFTGFKWPWETLIVNPNKTCRICKEFISIDKSYACPCILLGEDEARRRSIETIEKYEKSHRKNKGGKMGIKKSYICDLCEHLASRLKALLAGG